ncbi:hypothetical protein [Rufibacter hautae]|uniref:Uncharacterized protein n=1 Tax=Rufibacter hautae TaxID=2595005 RepID=A0A5B6TEB9_9BACT|nr:hypothetical protein [Rufibacter hautae]KAA3438506.1 hypothetical protein FOA19_14830 [Rufibacter hautae]
MKRNLAAVLSCLLLSACTVSQPTGPYVEQQGINSFTDPLTQSLFADKASTISEENIQRMLFAPYKLPSPIRVALVNLENASVKRYQWNDEAYQKSQQAYADLLEDQLKKSGKVTKVTIVPDLLLPQPTSFTGLREAAVRMQADMVLVYSTTHDVYAQYKLFSKSDIKAFATTQALLLDVRTGIVPFSAIVTKDTLSQKKDNELDQQEARRRIQQEAVLLTLQEMGKRLQDFLKGS